MPIFIYAKTITVAVDAIHGQEEAIKEWMPTLTYLDKKLPEHNFKLFPFIPTSFSNMKKSIENKKIDFVISPPSMYVDLELSMGASKILTLVKEDNIAEFGSVIIASKSSNITKLSQVNNHSSIVTVAPLGLGGWLIGYDTFKNNHININLQNVKFLGVQEDVVKSIQNNRADIGILRTGIIEELQTKKLLNLKNITIINRQYYRKFPFICSTELYPEWSFARTKNVDNKISREVVLALLSLPYNSNITKNNNSYSHWTAPFNYQKVHKLMKRLEVGPYKDQSYKFIKKWVVNHQEFFYSILFIVIAIVFFLIYSKYINAKLLLKDREKDVLIQEIKKLAYNDVLTDIPNRLSVMKSFEKELEFAYREQLSISVMFIDLDNFKLINDILGHEEGDRVLKKCANILKTTLRKNDFYGRIGGDEFIVITLGIENNEDLKNLISKLLDRINKIELPLKLSEKFGASIGVVNTCPSKDTTIETLLKKGDELMYLVKKKGKNNYIINA